MSSIHRETILMGAGALSNSSHTDQTALSDHRVISRRLLVLFLLLIVVSAAGIFVLSRYISPRGVQPRIDMVPVGAYVIPWMVPSPSIEFLRSIPPLGQPWNLSSDMMGALRLDLTFTIITPNSTRIIPSMIYLGHDLQNLYVGGNFIGMYQNPFNTANAFRPNYFDMPLDTGNNGILAVPEAGSYLQANLPCPFLPNLCGEGANGWGASLAYGYHDLVWRDNPPFLNRSVWDFAENVCQQPITSQFQAVEYNNITGTLAVVLSRHLAQPGSCADGLQMQPGDRWVMGFLFELGFANPNGIYDDLVSGWPRTAYPYLTNDASWWPKLAIELANPPSQFA